MIPAIKNKKLTTKKLEFYQLSCFGEQMIVLFTINYVQEFFPLICVAEDKKSANVILAHDKNLKNGAYALKINNKCITILYGEKEGVRNALATILQSIEMKEDGYIITCCDVQDYPDFNYRSVMIDMARGLPNYERLIEDIKRLSLAKCNKLHLHLMDSLGVCYNSDVFEVKSDINGTKLYSKEQLRRLVIYCEKLGIEVIPEIEFPAHATLLTKLYPKLKCQVEVENQSGWTVCLGNEKTYVFFEKLVAEICEIFSSKYIHIGGDEHAFYDLLEANRRYHWKECKNCRERMEKENLANERELFYYAICRMRDIARRAGRNIQIWNDELDLSKDVKIPKDCTIQFWRIANKNRGPRTDCSFEKLLQIGCNVICSPFEYCYIDLEEYANPEKVSTFNFKEYANDGKFADKICGCEVCAWEYGNPKYTHYVRSFAPSAILLLAKMWDNRNVSYDKEYKRVLSKLILGHGIPHGYDFFELFGSIMPPRINGQNSYATIKNELMDEETLQRHKKILSNISYTYSPFYLNKLLLLVEEELKEVVN